MKRAFLLLFLMLKQAFSGEFTGGDKINIGILKGNLPVFDKGEFTGGDKLTTAATSVIKSEETK
jgi:hypothetical protein